MIQSNSFGFDYIYIYHNIDVHVYINGIPGTPENDDVQIGLNHCRTKENELKDEKNCSKATNEIDVLRGCNPS